uniref:Uncharacterized protein n=1 Tax=Rhizophora mucronata TaxID=61149 RepID=A0A2P2N540_RHIMU
MEAERQTNCQLGNKQVVKAEKLWDRNNLR